MIDLPSYNVDIKHIVSYTEAKGLIDRASNIRDKFIVAILYLTGARPIEICYNKDKKIGLKKDDIFEKDSMIHVIVKTAKLGESKKFRIDERELIFEKDAPFMNHVLTWQKKCKDDFLLTIRELNTSPCH